MSSLFSGLFGGNTQSSQGQNQSSSSNQAFPTLQNALGGQLANSGAASNQMANMLGLNGPSGQQTGFDNWRNSTGYQFGLNQGVDSITGNAATQGLLDSGSTLKAVDTFGQNYANTQYQNYLNPLQALLSSGNMAANILGGAGQVTQSSGSNSSNGFSGPQNGISPLIGGLLSK